MDSIQIEKTNNQQIIKLDLEDSQIDSKDYRKYLLQEQQANIQELNNKNWQGKQQIEDNLKVLDEILDAFPRKTKHKDIEDLKIILCTEIQDIKKSKNTIDQYIENIEQLQDSEQNNVQRLANHCSQKASMMQDINVNLISSVQEEFAKNHKEASTILAELKKLKQKIGNLQVESRQQELILNLRCKIKLPEEQEKLRLKINNQNAFLNEKIEEYLNRKNDLNSNQLKNKALLKIQQQNLQRMNESLQKYINLIKTDLPIELDAYKKQIEQDSQEESKDIDEEIKLKKRQYETLNKNFEQNLSDLMERHKEQIQTYSDLSQAQVKKFADQKHKSKNFHYLFCLDHSGSMFRTFEQVNQVVNKFLSDRFSISQQDQISCVLFDDTAFTIQEPCKILQSINLNYDKWGNTDFEQAFKEIEKNILLGDQSFVPVIIFMTDGDGDGNFGKILQQIKKNYEIREVMLICIGFGSYFNQIQLEKMSSLINGSEIIDFRGKRIRAVKSALNVESLRQNFQDISQYLQEDTESLAESIDTLNLQKRNLQTAQQQEIDILKYQYKQHFNEIEQNISSLQQIKDGVKMQTPQQLIEEKNEEIQKKISYYEQNIHNLQQNIKQSELEIVKHQSFIDQAQDQVDESLESYKKQKSEIEQQILADQNKLEQQEAENQENLEEFGFNSILDYQNFMNNLKYLGKIYISLNTYCQNQMLFVQRQQTFLKTLEDCILDNLEYREKLIKDDLQLFQYYSQFIEGIEPQKPKQCFENICQYIFYKDYDIQYKKYINILNAKIISFCNLVNKCKKEDTYDDLIDGIVDSIMQDLDSNIDIPQQQELTKIQLQIKQIDVEIQKKTEDLKGAQKDDKEDIKELIQELKDGKKEKQEESKELQKEIKESIKAKKKEIKKPVTKSISLFIDTLNQSICFVLQQLSKRNFVNPMMLQLSNSQVALKNQSSFFKMNEQQLLTYTKNYQQQQ